MKKLGFGFMRLPLIEGNEETIDLEEVKQMVDVFMEGGFTYFDTAYPYHNGKSEEALRECLVKRYPRDSFTIADKMPIYYVNSKEDNETYFQTQLTRLGVSMIDYYLIHCLDKSNYPRALKAGTFEFLKEKKENGLIKEYGFSFHDSPSLLEQILEEHPEVDFVQLQINYLDWINPQVASKECYEIAVKHHKKVIVMEPVKGGKLATLPQEMADLFLDYSKIQSIPSYAIRYCASLKEVFMVLSGMSNLKQVIDNVSYMEDFKPLNKEEESLVEKVRNLLFDSKSIPCTGCKYCVPHCKQTLQIPKLFKIFNDCLLGMVPYPEAKRLYHETIGEAHCVGCKSCCSFCPQHILINERLEEVKKYFSY